MVNEPVTEIDETPSAGGAGSANRSTAGAEIPGAAPGKPLTPQAIRALEEAEARRRAEARPLPPEIDGRGGEEPTRYGDWEKGGLAIDF